LSSKTDPAVRSVTSAVAAPVRSRGASGQVAKRAPLHQGPLNWRALLTWLMEDGCVAPAARSSVAQRLSAGQSSLHPLVRLAGAGLTDLRNGEPLELEGLLRWLGGRTGLGYLRIDPLKVDVARVTEVMSAAYAEKRRVLPVQVGLTEVTIATSEPYDTAWVQEIAAHTRKTIRLTLASPQDIARYTAEFYSLARSVRQAQKTGEVTGSVNFEQLVELGKHKQLDANDQGVVQVVDWLWGYAFEQRASDIHLEPRRDQCAIRLRIDGVLHTVYHLPQTVMAAVTARIKLLGRMDVVERRRPQDGRIKTRSARGQEIEMRLSTLPTAFGEKLVMRIFDPDTAIKPVAALGFEPGDAERWEHLVAQPHGIILVTGPTGSGKTTTLYATLKRVATEEVNVCTVEDPIEMVEPAFNQTQVQSSLDLGFAEGLRALMRQDPDVIMVGEIRDLATAEMAVQASLTGHLVFSTLHTNDAAGAISRLLDLGVPSYLINATLIGVLAQRLVRMLCPDCKQPDETLLPESLAAALPGWTASRITNGHFAPCRPVGCLACRMTGFRGRGGLFELLCVDEGVRQVASQAPDLARIRRAASAQGLTPLRLAGLQKVSQGLTTLDEVLRSTPDWAP
jgi:general secretion pathway protein E